MTYDRRGYENLANAIIERAADDYWEASAVIRKYGGKDYSSVYAAWEADVYRENGYAKKWRLKPKQVLKTAEVIIWQLLLNARKMKKDCRRFFRKRNISILLSRRGPGRYTAGHRKGLSHEICRLQLPRRGKSKKSRSKTTNHSGKTQCEDS